MADSPREDQELLRQLSKGNETAFSALYERYQGPLYRFALHMSGNRRKGRLADICLASRAT